MSQGLKKFRPWLQEVSPPSFLQRVLLRPEIGECFRAHFPQGVALPLWISLSHKTVAENFIFRSRPFSNTSMPPNFFAEFPATDSLEIQEPFKPNPLGLKNRFIY